MLNAKQTQPDKKCQRWILEVKTDLLLSHLKLEQDFPRILSKDVFDTFWTWKDYPRLDEDHSNGT